MHPIEWRYL